MSRIPGPLLIGVLLLAAAAHIGALSFLCDDAHIAFRYARNLVEGHGLVFNPGERVEGYSSLLWTLASAAILRLGGRPEVWATRVSATVALLSLAFLLAHQRRRGGDFVILGTFVAGSAGWAAWATGGLETGLFTALVSVGFVATRAFARGDGGSRDLFVGGAALGFACLTRPEGALVAGLLALHVGRRTLRGPVPPGRLLVWTALWVVPVALHLSWRYAYYGHFVPNTFHVKAQGASMIPRGLEYVGYALTRLHLDLLAIPFLAAAVRRSRGGPRPGGEPGLAAWIVLPYTAYVVSVGGDFMDLFRFLVPILPILFLAVAEVTAPLAARGRGRVVVAAGLAVWIGLNVRTSRDALRVHWRHELDSIGALANYVEEWSAVGRFVDGISAPTDTLAVTAAGCIPYYADRYTIDQLGLVAPDLSDYYRRDGTRPGHMLQIRGEVLLALRPQFLLGSAVLTPPDQIQRTLYIEPGWEAAFEREYETASVILPELGRRLTFAVRADVAARGSGGP